MSSWELHGQMGRPFRVGIQQYIGHSGDTGLDNFDVLFEQVRRDLLQRPLEKSHPVLIHDPVDVCLAVAAAGEDFGDLAPACA